MYFANVIGLYLLSFILLLVLLYMIKAKPKEAIMPSLMFFSDDKKVKKYNSILKKLLIRTLFFLQLAFIILLALAAANPFIDIPIDAYSLNTVVVVDVSASMSTVEKNVPRIDLNKQDLINSIYGRVSIILAEENPVVLASNISASRAKAILTNIDSKDIPTRLDSSITFASEILGSERGNIIVYSDFVLNEEDDIVAAKKLAEANDKRVVFVSTGQIQQNAGFTSLNLYRGRAEAFVRNFADYKKTVDVRLDSEGNSETKRIDINPESVERISFNITPGKTELRIIPDDKLSVDNYLYLINPYKEDVDILLITSNKEETPVRLAIEANPQFKVQVTYPPVIPDLDFDVVILSDIDNNMLLPNTFRDLNKYKESGGKVVIMAQEGLADFNIGEITSLELGGTKTDETEICVDIVNRFTSRFGNIGCFSSTKRYYAITTDNSSVVLASTSGGDPVFILEDNLFYYGIIDEYSGFKDQINYPLFWDDLVNGLIGKESLSNFNYKAGDIVETGNSSDKKILDTIGFVELGSKEIAVNLLNRYESDIFRDSVLTDESELDSEFEKINMEVNIDKYLLIIASFIFLFELVYIKRRGDL
jgi:hypothetical protein